MNSAVAHPHDRITLAALGEFAQQHASDWFERCDAFFEWQKMHFLRVTPSAAFLAEHKSILKVMLRTLRLLYVEVSDPDLPNRDLAEDFHWRLRKLEDSWFMFHGAMTDAQAEEILNRVLPA